MAMANVPKEYANIGSIGEIVKDDPRNPEIQTSRYFSRARALYESHVARHRKEGGISSSSSVIYVRRRTCESFRMRTGSESSDGDQRQASFTSLFVIFISCDFKKSSRSRCGDNETLLHHLKLLVLRFRLAAPKEYLRGIQYEYECEN